MARLRQLCGLILVLTHSHISMGNEFFRVILVSRHFHVQSSAGKDLKSRVIHRNRGWAILNETPVVYIAILLNTCTLDASRFSQFVRKTLDHSV